MNRHAVLFKPGAYSIQVPVRFCEQLAGLGETPGAVTITGGLDLTNSYCDNSSGGF